MSYKYHELLKQRFPLADYISKYVNIKLRGAGEYVGLCPFHQEKTPSFTISELKKFFYCFGCGAHGDVFAFVMQLHNITYKEALHRLAEEAGIKLPTYDNKSNTTNQIQRYYTIHKEMSEWYHAKLLHTSNNEALNYLQMREISIEVIKKYQLGYAVDNKALIKQLLSKFSREDLVTCKALFVKSGDLFNPLAGRVTFPICDTIGRVVGFGGRILHNNETQAKYLNSSESDIFHKGTLFYGLHIAVAALHRNPATKQEQQQKKELVVVEGYLDVLALASKNIDNAVAPLGANIKNTQIHTLWQYVNKPVLCFDNDIAGKKAMLRAAHNVLPDVTPEKSVAFITLKQGKDPDEIIKSRGEKYWKENVQTQQIDLADFLFKEESKMLLNDQLPETKAVLREKLVYLANQIKHPTLRSEYKYYFNSLYWDLIRKHQKEKVMYRSNKEGSFNFSNAYNGNKYVKESLAVQETILRTTFLENKEEWDVPAYLRVLFSVLLKHTELLDDVGILEKLARIKLNNKYSALLRDLLLCQPVNSADFVREICEQAAPFHLNSADNLEFNKMVRYLLQHDVAMLSIKDINIVKQTVLKIFKLYELYELSTQMQEIQKNVKIEDDTSIQKNLLKLKQDELRLRQELNELELQ
ncbi:DNA primase [Alphaproteobacteria bacterium]